MKFDTPMELAEHLYNETVEPDMTADERAEVAAYASRFALQRFIEHSDT